MNHSKSIVIAVLLAATPAAQTWSQEKGPEADTGGYHWGLGAGVGVLQKAYIDIDSEVIPLPILFFDNRWISVNGPSIDLKLPLDGPVSLALRAEYARDGYDASDSPALLGMADRKDSFWYGAAVQWRNPLADVSFAWLTDASDYSSGQRATLTLEHGFEHGKFEFRPRLGATWLSEDYVDYYYGVTAAEALPSRAAYRGDSAVNLEAGLRTSYELKPNQSVFLDARVEFLDNAIKDSPVVDGSTQSSVFLGYIYRFR